jgi:transcriptional regulator with XRE-family HTH domain
MARSEDNPLTHLLRERMAALGLRQKDLLDRLAVAGIDVDKSAISYWLSGGGISDRHRPAVALVLEVPLGLIQERAAQRDAQLAEARVERACA